MKKIFKYTLEEEKEQHIVMPMDAKILCAKTINNAIYLWAIVDPDAQEETRVIHVIGTGWDMTQKQEHLLYIDTVEQCGGVLIWHIFEEIK